MGKLEDDMAEDEDGSPFNVLATETELLKTACTALEGSTAENKNHHKNRSFINNLNFVTEQKKQLLKSTAFTIQMQLYYHLFQAAMVSPCFLFVQEIETHLHIELQRNVSEY